MLNFQLLYRKAVEEVPEDDYTLPLSEAEVRYLQFLHTPSIEDLKRIFNEILR